MASTGGISGLAVAFASVGGLLVYAGLRGTTPIGALREVSGGKPAPVSSTGTTLTGSSVGSAAGNAAQAIAGQLGGGVVGPRATGVAGAAQKYAGDKYSQVKRTQVGWSDCSSFCDKILTDVGVPPPVKWASTANYRISPEWKTIRLADSQAGDIAVNSHHMVMILGPGGKSAIGQQNPRVNVRSGTVDQLIDNYQVKRYVGRR